MFEESDSVKTGKQTIMDKNEIKNGVINALKTIFDPEIPVNVYDMGLIYEIRVEDDATVYIKMTLTAPNCPIAESLPVDIHDSVKLVEGVKDVVVDLVFDPPWDTDMMSEAAQLELGIL